MGYSLCNYVIALANLLTNNTDDPIISQNESMDYLDNWLNCKYFLYLCQKQIVEICKILKKKVKKNLINILN